MLRRLIHRQSQIDAAGARTHPSSPSEANLRTPCRGKGEDRGGLHCHIVDGDIGAEGDAIESYAVTRDSHELAKTRRNVLGRCPLKRDDFRVWNEYRNQSGKLLKSVAASYARVVRLSGESESAHQDIETRAGLGSWSVPLGIESRAIWGSARVTGGVSYLLSLFAHKQAGQAPSRTRLSIQVPSIVSLLLPVWLGSTPKQTGSSAPRSVARSWARSAASPPSWLVTRVIA